MATVYLVEHLKLESTHALKVLHITTRTIRERLLQEGRIQSRIRHPNIVSVTDVVTVQGSWGLVMEYVEGPSLRQLLNRQRLTLDQVDLVARGLMEGISAAHKEKLIHRDLKPANVLMAMQKK
jgi:serine/threonine-protein kinase